MTSQDNKNDNTDYQMVSEELEKIIKELNEKVKNYEKEIEGLKKSLQFSISDFHNMQNKHDKEVEKIKSYSITGFAAEIVSVLDDLNRAKEHMKEESAKKVLDMIITNTNKTFNKYKIEEIEVKVGDEFHYDFHQIFSREKSTDVAPNHITKIILPGYKIKDRVLRHALVAVSE